MESDDTDDQIYIPSFNNNAITQLESLIFSFLI